MTNRTSKRTTSAITVGRAELSELDRLLSIHQSAFPDLRGVEPRRRNFLANPRGGFDRLFVARRDGEPVGHAFLFDLRGSFGGVLVPLGGIASVGVAPEARGSGVAGTLLDHLHARSREEGHALTMLYAFRQGFYRRLGYVQAPSHRVLSIAPSAFAGFAGQTYGHRLRTATGDDLPRLRELHLREAARHTGWTLRSEALWLRTLTDERKLALVATRADDAARGPDSVRGAIFNSLEQDEPHARTVLHVDELLAEDEQARSALYAHLHAQRDQVAEIVLPLAHGAAGETLELGLVDADGHRSGTHHLEHPLGTLAGGPMLRVLDPVHALSSRGYRERSDTPLILEVDGRRLSIDTSPPGTGAVVRDLGREEDERDAGHSEVELRLDARTLAAVAFAGWKVEAAHALGWLELPAEDPAARSTALARAGRFFALPPFFARDPF